MSAPPEEILGPLVHRPGTPAWASSSSSLFQNSGANMFSNSLGEQNSPQQERKRSLGIDDGKDLGGGGDTLSLEFEVYKDSVIEFNNGGDGARQQQSETKDDKRFGPKGLENDCLENVLPFTKKRRVTRSRSNPGDILPHDILTKGDTRALWRFAAAGADSEESDDNDNDKVADDAGGEKDNDDDKDKDGEEYSAQQTRRRRRAQQKKRRGRTEDVRRNRPQRCGLCGGLGHKRATCSRKRHAPPVPSSSSSAQAPAPAPAQQVSSASSTHQESSAAQAPAPAPSQQVSSSSSTAHARAEEIVDAFLQEIRPQLLQFAKKCQQQ